MKRKYTKAILRVSNTVILSALAVCMCAPVILTLFASFKSGQELEHNLMPILSGSEGPASWKLLPLYPTLRHYVKLLFEMPDFFIVFWNSVKITALILAGQAAVAVPAAWAFAKFNFRGKNVLLMIYIILMLMPFQVTMLPSYLVMDRIGLMNTQASVILPAIFSTLPVFIIYRGFVAIPKELLEAAQVDGAGELAVFVRIGIPLGMPGILSALVLGFLEYWNMMEQPLAFIQDKTLWPLSLYLPEIQTGQAGTALAASVVVLIPAAFVFSIGQDYLEQGIIASGIKE